MCISERERESLCMYSTCEGERESLTLWTGSQSDVRLSGREIVCWSIIPECTKESH